MAGVLARTNHMHHIVQVTKTRLCRSMRNAQESQARKLSIIELGCLLHEGGLSCKKFLRCSETIHLCCSCSSTLIECLEDPVTVWLDLRLILKLCISVFVVFLHILVLFFLILLALGNDALKGNLLFFKIINKFLRSCHFGLVFLLRLCLSLLFIGELILQIFDDVIKQRDDALALHFVVTFLRKGRIRCIICRAFKCWLLLQQLDASLDRTHLNASFAFSNRSFASSSSFLACKYASFSSFLSSVISDMYCFVSLIFAIVSSFSFVRSSISFSSFAIFAKLFLICQSRSLTVFVISWYSSKHCVFFARSSAPSSWSVLSISSMAPITSSKCPAFELRIWTARAARRMLCDFFTWPFNALYALAAGALTESCNRDGELAICKNVSTPGLMDLANNSRASSLVKISKALLMPSNSASRISFLTVHSSCLDWHASFVWSKNSMSAFICFSVSS